MFKTHTLFSPLARFLSLVCYWCHDILFLAAKKYATLFVYFGGVLVGFLRSFLCFLLCDKDRNAHKQTLRQRDNVTLKQLRLRRRRTRNVTSATNDEDKLNYVDVNFSAAGKRLTSQRQRWRQRQPQRRQRQRQRRRRRTRTMHKAKDKTLWGATELAAFLLLSREREIARKRERERVG